MGTAAVVCRQLGFPDALDMTGILVMENEANVTYWFEESKVDPCIGEAVRIEQCDHMGWRDAPDFASFPLDYNILCASEL